jgi:serine protease inhibitor ecotin
LTNKWALIRQIAQIMASRQESDLKVFIDEAKKWEMDCKRGY